MRHNLGLARCYEKFSFVERPAVSSVHLKIKKNANPNVQNTQETHKKQMKVDRDL